MAVIARDGNATYSDLLHSSRNLAGQMERHGVRKGDTVAICLGNEEALSFIVSYFACQWLGAVPVPINPRLSPDEKAFIARHSNSSVLITGNKYLPSWQERLNSLRPSLRLSIARNTDTNANGWFSLEEWLNSSQAEIDPAPLDADDPLDLLYTSGTTGMPKGVITPQGNLMVKPGDPISFAAFLFTGRVLHAVPLCGYTGCHGVMLQAIRAGGTQIIHPEFHVARFLQAIQEEQASTIAVVPTMLTLMMNAPEVSNYRYTSLQFVFSASAAVPPSTVRKMAEVWPHVFFINVYGQTEAGGNMICVMGPRLQDHLDRPGSVGFPSSGAEVYILDENDRPLPPGEIGEIAFRSDKPPRRYYQNDVASKELWRNGYLHTGDIGYVDRDGYVYITDRKKDMIIRGGYNIFALEVEQVLYDHPAVAECAVIGIPHPALGEDLLAVIVPKPGQSVTADEIRAFCLQRLADYKSPRHAVLVDHLPRNAMGKVLKQELRETYKSWLVRSESP
jgi:acyl-CoA synthetase (AMP-forming)/AMP-acid ligase II